MNRTATISRTVIEDVVFKCCRKSGSFNVKVESRIAFLRDTKQSTETWTEFRQLLKKLTDEQLENILKEL